jgi:hypothetical protein
MICAVLFVHLTAFIDPYFFILFFFSYLLLTLIFLAAFECLLDILLFSNPFFQYLFLYRFPFPVSEHPIISF